MANKYEPAEGDRDQIDEALARQEAKRLKQPKGVRPGMAMPQQRRKEQSQRKGKISRKG